MEEKEVHVVMIPSPGMGHLIPMIQFANRVLSHGPVKKVTLVIISGRFPETSLDELVTAARIEVNLHKLPPVSIDDYPPTSKGETIISVIMNRSVDPLRELLSGFSSVSALVLDLFGTDMIDVAKEFDIPSFVFFPSTAIGLSVLMNLPNLEVEVNKLGLPELITAPGCPHFRIADLPDAFQDPKDEAYGWFMRHVRKYREADAIIENSFDALETRAIMALRRGDEYKGETPPVYFVGPLIKNSEGIPYGAERHECLKWLDGQPDSSVLFACFGSRGTMSEEQLVELAAGLEMSGQKFIWVVRLPDKSKAGSYFSIEGKMSGPAGYLPSGFLERNENKGMVCDGWAPQTDVLKHPAVGGFLSHCGWNSTLEAVVNGVAIIGWPLYAEQRMNAKILEEEIGIAVGIDYYEKEVVSREEVEKKVRFLMEEVGGEKLKKKAKELKLAATEAIKEGGSSWNDLALVFDKFSSKFRNPA